MSPPVIRPLVAVLVVSVLVAGCASPGDGDDEEGAEFTEQTQTTDEAGADQGTPDQDAGAEPVAPPGGNGTNETTGEDAGAGDAT